MSSSPFVSIIIPTYNRAQMLPVTLDSFLSQDYPSDRYEIIIMDNNSRDTTREIASRYVDSSAVSVRYLFEKRQGVHYARNSAAKQAKGEILYFTDDDMAADRALLGELVKVFDLYPEVGCATGLVLPSFQKEPPEWVCRFMWNGLLSLTEKDIKGDLIVSENLPVYSCHQAIRRDLFFKAGGFNPENTAGVWIGDGETGLNIKLRNLGYRFAYTANSIIYHLIPPHRTTLRYLVDRIGNQGYCDSYTDYREHRDRRRILTTILKRNSSGIVRIFVRTFLRILKKKESWRFIPAHMMYIHRRNVYEYRLYRNSTFRRCVEVDDWLTNEHYDIKF
ncbi:Glycosyltransferase, GT2 family [Syntrophus gentianae]|uniref:Glycosyltransferase, GT2 family n=1 Tax=Syntrophus gentianae TaxID=43775 RepID=A0A1H7X700_9BACT|nr:glycosyltransferase family 2 protein [Syntrophus gentianae]SEM29596.1 Glycosyltransferase, GT2 family [Syntrophus gentianae]